MARSEFPHLPQIFRNRIVCEDGGWLTFICDQANVMLAYPIPEAEFLLTSKLEAAKSGLENCEEDLDFLREQITVRCFSSYLLALSRA